MATKKMTPKHSTETQSKLRELFIEELKDILGAEKQLSKALPKLAKAATSDELVTAFQNHLAVTETQITRLEEVFAALGEKPSSKKCEAMAGLVEESESIVEDTDKDTLVRDCGLIIAAQKVEHYEIATYGSLKALANIMGEKEVAELLDITLTEEKETDVLLTEIAMSYVNEEALSE